MAPMAHPQSRPPATLEDYLSLPRDVRAELVEGVIYPMTPAPTPGHQDIVGLLYRALSNHVEQSGSGLAYVAPIGVHLLDAVVEPDVIVVFTDFTLTPKSASQSLVEQPPS